MSDNVDDTTQTLQLVLPAPPTVLIVDDDHLVRARLHELVAAEGYPVRTAANGLEALDVLANSSASIVITDLNMPTMNGLDLCRGIRERAWSGYVYIVLLTVLDEEKDILAGLDAGADDYLSKRTSAAQFTARLRTAKRVLSLEYSLKHALEKKHHLAMTDALTGVYNRRYLIRHLGRELKRAQRFGGDVSLLLVDVDHFKHINDNHGHAVGDQVLKMITRQMVQCFQRETDWCARLGGDEFAMVLEGTKVADARACAEKVRQTIGRGSIDNSAISVHISVSIGVAGLDNIADRNSATVQTLMHNADENLYISKSRGGNRVTSSAPNGTHAGAREPSKQRSIHVSSKASVGSLR